MKEGSFKLVLILFFFNFCFSQDNVNQTQFLNLNLTPFQNNNTIIGLGISNTDNYNISLSIQNWFTKNLYLSGILYPDNNNKNLSLSYSFNLGYAFPLKNKQIKNIIFNFGYNKKQYAYSNFKNISLAQIFYIRFEKIDIGFMYNYIDGDKFNYQQLGVELFKTFKNNYIFKLGTKLDYGNKEYINTLYFTFNYCI